MVARGIALGCAAALWLGPAALAQSSTRVEPIFGGAVVEAAVTGKAAFIVQYDDGESDVTYAGTPAVGTYELAMLFEDVGDNFATGDRLVRGSDLCDDATVRFLELPLPGSGTRLTVWIANPRGSGPADPPSFTVRVFDEPGNEVGVPTEFRVDAHALELEASLLSALSFGTLRFDFGNSNGGTVYAESSAQGRFSIGVTSQCDDRF